MIIQNAVKCLDCDTVIESRHRHDFVTCPCGNVSVDGGKDYLRRVCRTDNWIDYSETDDAEL